MLANPCVPVELQRELFGDYQPTDAELAAAVRRRITDTQTAKARQKMVALNFARHEANLAEVIGRARTEKGKAKAAQGYVRSVMVPDVAGRYGAERSIEMDAEAISREMFASMAESVENFRLKTKTRLKFRDAAKGEDQDLIRAIVDGRMDSPEAAKFAESWAKVNEALRQEFNRLGGQIGKRENWNLPQSHDPAKVGSVSFKEWYDDIRPLLDLESMDVPDAELEGIARMTYEKIRRDGLLVPGQVPAGVSAAIANRRRESRFFQFKDGDSWLKYNEKYGAGQSVFNTIAGHIQSMSHDIAMMRALGPNPSQMYNTLTDVVTMMGGSTKGLDNIWAEVSGKLVAAPQNMKLAQASESIGNVQVSTKLLSALISAVSDDAFNALTHWYNGTTSMRSAFASIRKLNPNSKADRIQAFELGLDGDAVIRAVTQANRYSEITGYGFTARASDISLRMSGLTAWTHASKQQFEVDFLRSLAYRSWDDLAAGRKGSRRVRLFERYGLSESDWPEINKAIKTIKGNRIIDPQAIPDEDVRRRFMGMMINEGRFSVPTPGARERAIMHQGLQRGTVARFGLDRVMEFKSFPITVLTTHWARVFATESKWDRFSYAAAMVLGLGAVGMLTYQAKRIAGGKEPLPLSKELWLAGVMQGGGLGILGDLVFMDHNRFGGSIWSSLLGPTAGDLEKYLSRFLLGTTRDFMELDHDKAMDRLRRIPGAVIKDFTPLQLWYTKLLMDRYIFDRINKEVDPKWESRVRKYERKLQTEQGAGYWWQPGEMAPR